MSHTVKHVPMVSQANLMCMQNIPSSVTNSIPNILARITHSHIRGKLNINAKSGHLRSRRWQKIHVSSFNPVNWLRSYAGQTRPNRWEIPWVSLRFFLIPTPQLILQRKGNYKKQFYRKADCLQTGKITFEAQERNIIPHGCQLGCKSLHVSTQTRSKSSLIRFARH